MTPLLTVEGLALRFGGVVALDGASLVVQPGEVCGLIGPNGAGKTTLFNCVSRLYTPDRGELRFAGEDLLRRGPHEIAPLGIARTFQNLAPVRGLTVRENLLLGAHHRGRAGFVSTALALPRARDEERRLREEADDLLARLELLAEAGRPAAGLPYGTLKRIELARALLGRPRLLMLDEPASGLSHAEVERLGELILELRSELGLTVLLVEHHMGLVMRITDRVAVLDFGRTIAQGAPAAVQRNPVVVAAYLGEDE